MPIHRAIDIYAQSITRQRLDQWPAVGESPPPTPFAHRIGVATIGVLRKPGVEYGGADENRYPLTGTLSMMSFLPLMRSMINAVGSSRARDLAVNPEER